MLEIYDHTKPGNLRFYYDFLKNNLHLEGDICEFGVFNGKSILATALLLKEMKSDKTVFGFDSFSGFPSFHENDDPSKFKYLLESGKISNDHYEKCQDRLKNKQHDFKSNGIKSIYEEMIDLDLDNICLIEGDFKKTTLENDYDKLKFIAVLMDCDLYSSYKVALPYCWDRLVVNGYIYLDEYYSLKYPGARIAVDEFFENKSDKPQKHESLTEEF